MAPTYRNDSTTTTWRGLDFSGEVKNVQPGHSIASREVIQESYMTLTSATPYYSPYSEWSEVRSSGETKTKVLDPTLVRGLQIYNRGESSGEADVKFNSASNNIVARLLPGGGVEFKEKEVYGKVSSVLIECATGAVLDFVAKK